MTARILPLQCNDLKQIPRFQPPGWKDVAALFKLRFEPDYSYRKAILMRIGKRKPGVRR
jgi:hypothetical protein